MYRLKLIIDKVYHVKFGLFVITYSASAFLFSALNLETPKPGVYFLDVGQGDSTLIISPEGHRILIDAGNVDGRAVTEIRKILPWFDRRIDLAIGTHADIDHVGGFKKIAKNFSLNTFLFSHLHTNKTVEKDLFRALESISTSTIDRGAEILFGKDFLKILYPDHKMKMTSDKDTNLFSIVAKLKLGTTTFMFTGDAPKSVELKLVNAHDDLRSDVLKAGHHGSKNSTDPIFVSSVDPAYSIISAGKNNRYGHPHKETINNLKNIKVFKTYEVGAIKF